MGNAANILENLPPKPAKLSFETQQQLTDNIKLQLKQQNACLIAHYYTPPENPSIS